MQIPKEAQLLRIFIGEADRWQGRPLFEAIISRAREAGLAGATVLKGPMGFGRTSHLHTAKLLEMDADMPIVIELIDTGEKIGAFLPAVREMVTGGLVTLEPVEVIMYRGDDKG